MTAMGIRSRIGQVCLVLVLYLHVCEALMATPSARATRDARLNTPATQRHPYTRKCDLVPQCQRYHGNLVLASSTAHGETRASWHTGYNRVKPPSKQQQQQAATTTVRQQQAQILQDYSVPSITNVLAFAIPAVGVWLCVPLLSMIDTSIVGLVAGTAQQAALNPAIAVINYSAKLMTFLFSGTTTMMAAALERDRRDNELTESLTDENVDNPQSSNRRTVQTLVGALQLSTLVGAGLGATVFVFARQLLGALVGGSTAVDPTILTAAMKYVRIRALGLAAAAMVGSAQTACLAQGDVRMPLYATIISAVTNLVLNLLLIRSPQSGAAGAAWATTLSQYIAAAWVVAWLMMAAKPKEKPTRIIPPSSLERQPKQQSTTGGFVCQSTRGFLVGRIPLGDWIKLPSKSIFRGFAPFVIPVITTQAGRASASATIDHVVSSSLCTASMAANQILTSVYYGLVPVAESLSLAAQNFVPGILEGHRRRGEQAFAMKRLLMSFLKAAGLCGVVLATIIGTLPLYAGAFTSDAAVRVLVSAVVPLIFVTCLKHGLFCASEGILLGQKDLKFLGTQYGIYTFLIPYILLQLKKAAIGGSSRVSLVSVWQVFLGYDLFRTVLMVGRILWLERKRGSAITAEAI